MILIEAPAPCPLGGSWAMAAPGPRPARRARLPVSPEAGELVLSAPRAAQLRLLDQALVLVGEEMPVDLRYRVHGDRDHDQKRGAAEIKRQSRVGDKDFRDQAD